MLEPLKTPVAASIGEIHAQPAPDLADSHLEALSPPEVIYDASATPAQGRELLFGQLDRLLDDIEKEATYCGLAVDVIHDKATNQVLCIRLVPVDVLSEGSEPARRIAT